MKHTKAQIAANLKFMSLIVEEPQVSHVDIKAALETISNAIEQKTINRSEQLKAADALWELRCVFEGTNES